MARRHEVKLPHWLSNQLKKKTRVYILPTRMGGYLNGLIFLMLLMSVGYNNNLLLIFTLFLFGQNLVWVIQTHFHLHTLKLKSILIEDGHAGETLNVQVIWDKLPSGPHQWGLELHQQNTRLKLTKIGLILPKRGRWSFDYLCVSTEMPFGLYKVWVYYKVSVTVHAWPAKLKTIPYIQRNPSFLEGENSGMLPGPHDVRNLVPYQNGEESRRISWKHYARSGELVLKEGEELTRSYIHFRVNETQDKEFHLSQIATQMIHCARTDTMFSLETPLKKTASGVTTKHLEDCLRELSIC